MRSSELKSGTAYQVEFRGRGWCCGNGESDTVVLWRTDYTNTEPIEVPLVSQPLVLPHKPVLLDIALEGARILLRVNGEPRL